MTTVKDNIRHIISMVLQSVVDMRYSTVIFTPDANDTCRQQQPDGCNCKVHPVSHTAAAA